MAALSLATDLGLGRPLEHELGVCLAALELAERLGCAAEERSDVYYVALLAHVGCTGAAPTSRAGSAATTSTSSAGAQVLGLGSGARRGPAPLRPPPRRRPAAARARPAARADAGRGRSRRLALMAANLCEGATLLARRLHMPEAVALALGQLHGALGRQGAARDGGRGGDLAAAADRPRRPRPGRASPARATGEAALGALARRRGRGYDPAIVDAALAEPDDAAAARRTSPTRGSASSTPEPEPVATISSAGLASVARAFGEFARRQGRLPARALEPRRRARGDGRRGARLLARRGRRASAPPASSTTSGGCRCRTGSGTSPAR